MSNKNRKAVSTRSNEVKKTNQQPQANARQATTKPSGQPNVRAVSASWEAPIPPPSILREYEDIVPGSAAGILALSESERRSFIEINEKQNNHRIESEVKYMNGNERRGNIGQYLAFTIAISLIILAGYLAYLKDPIQASAVALGVLVEGGIVWFIGGKAPSARRKQN